MFSRKLIINYFYNIRKINFIIFKEELLFYLGK